MNVKYKQTSSLYKYNYKPGSWEFYLIPIGLMDFLVSETRCWGLKSDSNRGELCLSAVVANISFQYWGIYRITFLHWSWQFPR